MTDTVPPNDKPKRNVPLWVKFFVPFHIVAITCWSIPYTPQQYMGSPPKVVARVKTDNPVDFATSSAEYLRTEFLMGNELYLKASPLKFYLYTTGFWQFWDMFSPNPASVDQYADAMVTFADGRRVKYQYPRIFSLSLGQKFLRERWRKFFERAGDPNFRYLWPTFAQRVAVLTYDDPKNPPVLVELHRHAMVINPPGQPENHDYSDELYFTYNVNQADLRKAKEF